MRSALLLLAVVAASASAQTNLQGLDARIADLDREIAMLDREIEVVGSHLDGTRADEASLDSERLTFQERLRDFERARTRYQIEAGRVRAMYDDLQVDDSPDRRRAYDDARYQLEDRAEGLRGESQMLNEWNAALNDGYRAHADRVRQSAGQGQRLSQRRAALRHERDVLDARRRRLAARRR